MSKFPFRSEADRELKGLRILVVEDEFAILVMIEEMLELLGCNVAGSSCRFADALSLAETCEADVALLDVNLGAQKVFPIAEILDRRGIPLVFCTGYGEAGLEGRWSSCAALQKPFLPADLARVLKRFPPETRARTASVIVPTFGGGN